MWCILSLPLSISLSLSLSQAYFVLDPSYKHHLNGGHLVALSQAFPLPSSSMIFRSFSSHRSITSAISHACLHCGGDINSAFRLGLFIPVVRVNQLWMVMYAHKPSPSPAEIN